jgi:type IV secretory pathway TraG/TraD family ATPase VirD4
MHELGIDIATGQTVHLSADAKRRHVYVIGKSGVGKTNLLHNLMLADLDATDGFCLIDPHGDEAERLADSIPPRRFDDVIYLDPADLSHSIAYNPLEAVEPDLRPLAAEHVLSAFAHVWGLSARDTPRLLHILRNALRLLLDTPDSTLLGLPKLLIQDRYRARLLARCLDPTVRMFWEEEFAGYNDRLRSDAISAIQNKAGAFVSNPAIRNIIGQARGTIHPSVVMDTGKVLICNLSKGRLGEETSSLLGALLTTGFAQAAEGRAAIPEEQRRDFGLYIDEFQNFATTSFATVLAEARKYRLSLVLAHQFLSQVPDALQDAVIGTANTTIAFRCGVRDASLLAAEFGLHTPVMVNDTPNKLYCEDGVHSPQVLTNTPSFQAWLKTVEQGEVAKPILIATHPARPGQNGLESVRNRSRARYARPRAIIERNITRFIEGV